MPTHIPELDNLMRSVLCQAMGTYKLIDILRILDQPKALSPGRNPKYPRLSSIGISKDNPVRHNVCESHPPLSFFNSIGQ
jgi:hypothetical protein